MLQVCEKMLRNCMKSLSLNTMSYRFSKTNKRKWEANEAEFESTQKEFTKDYFESYRKEVEKDSVIRDFRRQVFEKDTEIVGEREYEEGLDNQQRHLQKLLKNGSPEEINKYSKKIMQHIQNNRKMFKGYQNKDIFKDYAEYSAYKNNKVTYEDRNYSTLDNMARDNRTQRTYEFIDSLPEGYHDKNEIREEIQTALPAEYDNISISEYGRRIQERHNLGTRVKETIAEVTHAHQGKIHQVFEDQDKDYYTNFEQTYDSATGTDTQVGFMSTEALNNIYHLYLQGWTVRDISKRYGIMPTRTKFIIWSRARLFNEALPKFGLKYLKYVYELEEDDVQQYGCCDYGLDLEQMHMGDDYKEITSWNRQRVDSLRTPEKYTYALEQLQKKKKFTKFDLVQVGEHGVENKKHRLTEWKRNRGKGSDEYFLKNKVFKDLMFEKRKTKNVYY